MTPSRMRNASVLPIALSLFCLPSFAQSDTALDQFVRWLPGTYSSAELARRDTAFIDVQIRIVPLWPEAPDGHWFYLEQAYASRLGAPYRQAILHVTRQPDGRIASANHTLKNRQAFVGAVTDTALRAKLTRSDLDPEPPCVILFRRTGIGAFEGGTDPGGCPNAYRGASYFTNESTLTERTLTSWDRGWNAAGQHVWGTRKSGYTFDKIAAP